MSKKYLIFFFICSLLLCPTKLDAHWVDERLKGLSVEEKENLSFFFRKVIKEDHLGHVLFFSSKPACLTGEFLDRKTEKSQFFLKGWEVWKAKEHLFPHPNFLIYDACYDIRATKTLDIYFINKKTLDSCLSLHEAALKEKLEGEFSKEVFLKDLEEKKIAAFKNNEALTGFLLGYGIESSFAFQKKEQQTIFCTKTEHIAFIPSTGSQLVKLKGIDVHPLTFMGDPDSPEVQSLQNKYTAELEQIEALFQEKDILGQVLHALCSIHYDTDLAQPIKEKWDTDCERS
jgi:hypothetical protein